MGLRAQALTGRARDGLRHMAVLAGLVLACAQAVAQGQATGQSPAPDKTLAAPLIRESEFQFPAITLLDGRVIAPDYWKGKVVIIERWATWCPFCNRQNPNLNGLHRDYKGKGLEVLALSIDKTPQLAVDYMARKGYQFHAAMMSPEMRSRLGAMKSLPEVWVIGRDGRFKEYIPGEMFPEDVDGLSKWLTR